MSKKRSIILISIIAFLTLIFILCSTIFRVSLQQVVFSEECDAFSSEQIVSGSKIKKGKSIFFIDKNNVKENIEKSNPYAKVENVEIKFPNKIIYTISQRDESCFCLKGDTYYVLDNDLKILRTSLEEPTGLILISNLNVVGEAGDFAKNDAIKDLFTYFSNSYVATLDGTKSEPYTLIFPIEYALIDEIVYSSADNSVLIDTQDGFKVKMVCDANFEVKVSRFMGSLKNIPVSIEIPDRISGQYEFLVDGNGNVIRTNLD